MPVFAYRGGRPPFPLYEGFALESVRETPMVIIRTFGSDWEVFVPVRFRVEEDGRIFAAVDRLLSDFAETPDVI